MKRYYPLFVCLLLFASCNFRVYNNGKLVYKKWPYPSDLGSINDSILVFDAHDSLPHGAVLVNETKIYSPFFWFISYSPNFLMLNRAKTEAKRLGGRIVQVTDRHVVKTTRYKLWTKIYSITQADLNAYRRKEDSLNKALKEANKNFCVVHVKSTYSLFSYEKMPVYFNDSIRGYLTEMTYHKGVYTRPSIDFKTAEDGLLFITEKEKAKEREINWAKENKRVPLKRGEEYYFLIRDLIVDKTVTHIIVPVREEIYKNVDLYQ